MQSEFLLNINVSYKVCSCIAVCYVHIGQQPTCVLLTSCTTFFVYCALENRFILIAREQYVCINQLNFSEKFSTNRNSNKIVLPDVEIMH